jgi:hypothetical protein
MTAVAVEKEKENVKEREVSEVEAAEEILART